CGGRHSLVWPGGASTLCPPPLMLRMMAGMFARRDYPNARGAGGARGIAHLLSVGRKNKLTSIATLCDMMCDINRNHTIPPSRSATADKNIRKRSVCPRFAPACPVCPERVSKERGKQGPSDRK